MKKSKKPTDKKNLKKIITVISILIVVAILLVGVIMGINKARYYNDAAKQVGLAQIRELILLAVQETKKDAPVEPRTGDVYFPESRLYLPNPGLAVHLTYLYDKGDVSNLQAELSVSTYPVRGTVELYNATTHDSLFAVAVPKLQACSRGIKLVYQPLSVSDVDNELRQQVQLNSGQTLYIYLEKACPELTEIADLFKNVQSY